MCGPDPIRLANILTREMDREVEIKGHKLRFSIGIKLGPSYGRLHEMEKGETLRQAIRRIGRLEKDEFARLRKYAKDLGFKGK